MTGFVLTLALWSALGANAPRENRRGLDALAKGDTAKALKHLEKAAKADTADARYAYNLGTVQARTRKASPDAALGQALSHAKSPQRGPASCTTAAPRATRRPRPSTRHPRFPLRAARRATRTTTARTRWTERSPICARP